MQGFRRRVGVSHRSNANIAIGDATNKGFDAQKLSVVPGQGRGTIICSDTRYETPIPGSGYVFIFVAADVGVGDTI